jgi:hypothetical protein
MPQNPTRQVHALLARFWGANYRSIVTAHKWKAGFSELRISIDSSFISI